jgi:intein-encoded DNA endonuclease-like protein
MRKIGNTPGSWRVKHDKIPPDISKILYNEAEELASKGLGPVAVARRLSVVHSLSLSPGTIRHWMVGDRKPQRRNVFKPGSSPSLSYIIGANKGDGCTLVKTGLVKLEVTDMDFAQTFDANMATLFSRTIPNKIFVRRRAGRLPMYIVKYSSRQLTELLRRPVSELVVLASAFPREFLRGFFDAEGFVSVTAGNLFRVDVGLDNTEQYLLVRVGTILRKSFNLDSMIQRKRESGSIMSIRGHTFLKRRTSFCLTIRRMDGIKRFGNLVGFSISRKQQKLVDALEVLQLKGQRNRLVAWKHLYFKQKGEWIRRG